MIRHYVKPGITGWAQTHGERGETKTVEDMRRRVEKRHLVHRALELLAGHPDNNKDRDGCHPRRRQGVLTIIRNATS